MVWLTNIFVLCMAFYSLCPSNILHEADTIHQSNDRCASSIDHLGNFIAMMLPAEKHSNYYFAILNSFEYNKFSARLYRTAINAETCRFKVNKYSHRYIKQSPISISALAFCFCLLAFTCGKRVRNKNLPLVELLAGYLFFYT